MNTCKLWYIFTNFFTRFLFFIKYFSFLFRYVTIVDDPPFNLNFYNNSTIVDDPPFNLNFYNYSTIVDDPPFNLNFYSYSTIVRTFSCTDCIDFYVKHFFKHKTLRKDLENSHITLHSKKDLNVWSMEGSYTLYTDFHWIQVAVKGLLITKIFFKDSVNVVVYIFYMQLCFSLSTLLFWESEFSYHSSLRLCTTKVFFSIESIKISNELSNQTQYLHLQLDSFNKIRCLKNHSLFEINTAIFRWYKFKTRANLSKSPINRDL